MALGADALGRQVVEVHEGRVNRRILFHRMTLAHAPTDPQTSVGDVDRTLRARAPGAVGGGPVLLGEPTVAPDVSVAAVVVLEELRGDRIAPAMTRAPGRIDHHPHRDPTGANTSGSRSRCNVPEGHTMRGSYPSAMR